jgi:hypothetical protein
MDETVAFKNGSNILQKVLEMVGKDRMILEMCIGINSWPNDL